MAERYGIPRQIERQRVMDLFQRGLAGGHLLLTAPAGYGKSVALRQLAAHRPDTHLIALTPGDADPVSLGNRVAPFLAGHRTILLDDIHLLEGATEACHWLQRQLGTPSPRWLLAGRRLPFDPALLALLGQVTVLSQEVLAFSPAEAQLLVDQPDSPVREWQRRVQGWPLALSLLSRLPPTDDPLPTARSHLFPYLAATVFDRLPDTLRRFVETAAVPLAFHRSLLHALWPDAGEADRLLSEVERRNLYVQPAERPGWLRFHDLIRTFLLQRLGDERQAIGGRVVEWHVAQGNQFQAIEQALDSGLTPRAAELLAELPLTRFHTNTSYLTYRRWVRALDEEALARHPMLLVRLSNVLALAGGYRDEARPLTERAIALAGASGAVPTRLLAQTNRAFLDKLDGRMRSAQTQIEVVLADAACVDYPRAFALRIGTLIYGEMGASATAAGMAEEAVVIARGRGAVNEPMMNRANRMLFFLLPQGRFAQAEDEIHAILAHFADAPGWTAEYLVNLCALYAEQGDWPRLSGVLAQWDDVLTRVESPSIYVRLWRCHFRAVEAVAGGSAEAAEGAQAEYRALAENERSPLHLSGADWLATWHLRRSGDFDAAIRRAESALAASRCAAQFRPRLLLEQALAQGLAFLSGRQEHFSLHPEIAVLWRWRWRPQMARLRGLLAVICRRVGHPRWRRHWQAAFAGLSRPGYGEILTALEPQLGLHFWWLGVAEGLAIPEAAAALARIAGGTAALAGLLSAADPQVRSRCARALALAAPEESMAALAEAEQRETDSGVAVRLAEAQAAILGAPPPRLTVQLLGGFALHRGAEAIPDSAWPRPLVRRLFQYFAVNAGAPIPTERLLDDLWPQLEPDRALRNFRTAHSLLRQVLEPFLPPKAPNRYFAVTADTYTFDPEHRAWVDLHAFQATVRGVVADTSAPTPGKPPDAFLTALEGYAPVLPDLPYAEWLLACRRETDDLYAAGCFYAARAFLGGGESGAAIAWGRRAVQAAPWREEAYRVLMRAYARRGERAVALHLYQQARESLRDELGVDPAPETVWLAERLAAGQEI